MQNGDSGNLEGQVIQWNDDRHAVDRAHEKYPTEASFPQGSAPCFVMLGAKHTKSGSRHPEPGDIRGGSTRPPRGVHRRYRRVFVTFTTAGRKSSSGDSWPSTPTTRGAGTCPEAQQPGRGARDRGDDPAGARAGRGAGASRKPHQDLDRSQQHTRGRVRDASPAIHHAIRRRSSDPPLRTARRARVRNQQSEPPGPPRQTAEARRPLVERNRVADLHGIDGPGTGLGLHQVNLVRHVRTLAQQLHKPHADEELKGYGPTPCV